MPTLVYIHGRGQKGDIATERNMWYNALTTGVGCLGGEQKPAIPDDDHFQLAYWSDIFYPPKDDPSAPNPQNPQGLSAAEQAIVDRISQTYWQLQQQAAPPPLGDQAVGAPAAANATVHNIWTVAPGSADQVRSAQYEDSFLRDVIKYIALGYAEKVRVPLVKILTEEAIEDGHVMLVAHSFGTIISFDVLVRSLADINANRQQGEDAAGNQAGAPKQPLVIDTWVTMGCPLGWALDLQHRLPAWAQQAIVGAADLGDVLADAGHRALDFITSLAGGMHPAAPPAGLAITDLGLKEFPPQGVLRWANIYDPHDPVAYPPIVGTAGEITVSDSFLSNGKRRAFDVQILNDFDLNTQFNLLDLDAHNDQGYGECAQLAQLVADFWSRCS
ncbi:MAG TPA: hypothetical protein VF157_12795 [Chloroflexota bacterium]